MKNVLRSLCLFVAFLPSPIVAEVPSKGLVREMQFLLMAKGINPGPIEGIYGEKTENAIREYEKQNHLVQTGRPSYDLTTCGHACFTAQDRASHTISYRIRGKPRRDCAAVP
jgi:peptidoglycan hydrolase-like protein with peptidoglycan-binding domain